MFHIPAHKQVAANPAPIKTLADYIGRVQQIENVRPPRLCACGEPVRDAQCFRCGAWHDNYGFDNWGQP